MYLYKSIYEYAEAEYIVEKSRFIAHASPAENTEEAKLFIAGIKEKYKDATHNVPAFICGAGMEHQWASDDGEPQGTSGMPILKLISALELTNIAIVVTRYFGGIKLGTGGVARAYTHAAKLAIERAGICEVREGICLEYSFDYTYLSRIQNMSEEGRFVIEDISYTDVIGAKLSCMSEEVAAVKSLLADITGGKASLNDEQLVLAKYRLQAESGSVLENIKTEIKK
ncbi:MAG: YigZ family protein [Mogibacterium sp.]|nr:YigZ family protein [Mogibacterium sp.]